MFPLFLPVCRYFSNARTVLQNISHLCSYFHRSGKAKEHDLGNGTGRNFSKFRRDTHFIMGENKKLKSDTIFDT